MKKFKQGLALIALALLPLQVAAQQAEPRLAVELNAAEATETGCKVTFLATNELGSTLDRAALEMALFDRDGGIRRIVTLEFKALPENKTKVLQFQLAGLDCAELGRVLVNDVTACEGPELAANLCLDRLATSARPDIGFGV
ncbi:MAG: hypothetical protein ABS76_10525 [Pelagibacterium sp. SCN 64-44]|nr:MAG: hypothetical protein ABS76_10525 [Pelagibacterium sp. SCN 64-44]